MKEYFIRLFSYDKYVNELMLQAMQKTCNSPDACRLMSHLLAAQQTWLERCKNKISLAINLWPDWQLNTFIQLNEVINEQWVSFLESCEESEFRAMINYKNSKGEVYSNTLEDILAHVINHNTHHRAQIGQLLKASGLEKLPATDYIFYLRLDN